MNTSEQIKARFAAYDPDHAEYLEALRSLDLRRKASGRSRDEQRAVDAGRSAEREAVREAQRSQRIARERRSGSGFRVQDGWGPDGRRTYIEVDPAKDVS